MSEETGWNIASKALEALIAKDVPGALLTLSILANIVLVILYIRMVRKVGK